MNATFVGAAADCIAHYENDEDYKKTRRELAKYYYEFAKWMIIHIREGGVEPKLKLPDYTIIDLNISDIELVGKIVDGFLLGGVWKDIIIAANKSDADLIRVLAGGQAKIMLGDRTEVIFQKSENS